MHPMPDEWCLEIGSCKIILWTKRFLESFYFLRTTGWDGEEALTRNRKNFDYRTGKEGTMWKQKQKRSNAIKCFEYLCMFKYLRDVGYVERDRTLEKQQNSFKEENVALQNFRLCSSVQMKKFIGNQHCQKQNENARSMEPPFAILWD